MKKAIKVGIFLVSTTVSSFIFAQGNYVTPRTEWGQPDLQGVWNFSSNVPLQRAQRFGDREYMTTEEVAQMRARLQAADEASDQAVAQRDGGPGGYNDFWVESAGITDRIRTSHIVYPTNGRIPSLVEGVDISAGGLGDDVSGDRPVRFVVGGISKDGPEDRGLSERCIVGFNSGPPFMPSLYNNNVQIFQSRDTAVLLTEMIHDARVVHIGDRPALDENIGLWTGDSRGYYDGDTLVVETRNFNGLTSSFSAFGDSEDKLLIEKFTRIDDATVDYEWTIDDPSTFTDKITAIVPMTKVAGQLYEYACHEGNYGLQNTLRGARVAEQREAEAGAN
ncbi:MAG: hypothetical protein HOF74_09695 [Gammaproteobacteria bacterium]|jgi:hypothetical protein|nr:hypothetical protein [Gammaproteobacteria bacterium]MBT3860091.1 hypothetical protein [Gammaproteobacteria bacterium]MBT3987383.1 hypothetical protein [Gammaproteobacteria bacterium]MBT4255463.1 hypothetical protein [Gammaproteobacteria bacterium]MBT4581879.1 hypothetical protein [Gammaproteobacteria bacterium]